MANADPITTTAEQWRPVVGWEGLYEVSDHGRVRSLTRWMINRAGRRQKSQGRVLKNQHKPAGYPYINLCKDGVAKATYVHELVLTAFVGPRPSPSHYARHLNDDPKQNHVSNLAWGTPSENSYDKARNGNDYHAKRTHCKNGHEFTPDNIRRDSRYPGTRYCIACEKAAWGQAERWLKEGPKNPKTHCKRGHQMVEKNLIKARLPRRACLACARGRAYADHHGILDKLQEVSDSYYEQIMTA